jgi:hypothetical protein
VKELDLAFPEAQPEEYDAVRLSEPGEDPTPQHVQAGTLIRTWMSESGLPREHGNALFKAADEVARQTAHYTENQLAEYGHREYAKLQHLHGDQLEAKLRAAGRMIHRIEESKPGLKALLKQLGLGDSARIVTLILAQSERYWRRRTNT